VVIKNISLKITQNLFIEEKINSCQMNDIVDFVENQINKSPSYIKKSISYLSIVLLILIEIYTLIKFDFKKKNTTRLFEFIKRKRIPFFKDLISLYESLIILRVLDLNNEKKI